MARAAHVSGLLDKDFDDSWIVPARPRRPRVTSARRGVAAVAAVDSVGAPGPGIDIAPEPVVAPQPIVAPSRSSRATRSSRPTRSRVARTSSRARPPASPGAARSRSADRSRDPCLAGHPGPCASAPARGPTGSRCGRSCSGSCWCSSRRRVRTPPCSTHSPARCTSPQPAATCRLSAPLAGLLARPLAGVLNTAWGRSVAPGASGHYRARNPESDPDFPLVETETARYTYQP